MTKIVGIRLGISLGMVDGAVVGGIVDKDGEWLGISLGIDGPIVLPSATVGWVVRAMLGFVLGFDEGNTVGLTLGNFVGIATVGKLVVGNKEGTEVKLPKIFVITYTAPLPTTSLIEALNTPIAKSLNPSPSISPTGAMINCPP